MKNVKGLKMPRGDKESMLIYPVYIPPYLTFSEQQKIVDCLSSIDEGFRNGWMGEEEVANFSVRHLGLDG